MKAVVINTFGVANLAVEEQPIPKPGPGEIQIRMSAVSINFRDLLMVQGFYNPRQPLPLIPGSDGAGVITEVGEAVTQFKVGDRVAPIFAQSWQSGEPDKNKLASTLGGPIQGTLAEYRVLPETGVVPVPAHLSDPEASTLTCAALTAWSSLVTYGAVTAGDTILLQGTGGVSIFALQFAKLLGCRVIITSSSDEKLEKTKTLGAEHTINYKKIPQWSREIKTLTNGQGVDHIIEVGGANTLSESLKSIRIGGTISMIGVLSGTAAKLSVLPLLMKQIRIQGILVGHREGFMAMNRAIDANKLKPVVDRTFPVEQAAEAFGYMASGKHFGKICIVF